MLKKILLFLIVIVPILFITFKLVNMSGTNWKGISDFLGLITAIISIIGLVLQFLLSKQEQSSFRQQLIAVLHHAEGIADGLSTLENSLKNSGGDNTLVASIGAMRKNASDLQMGLMETRVGGKQLSDDLDKSYKEWAKLELELRMLPLKHFIEDKAKERINVASK